ncbi:MAG: choice-of-anchor B family protein [Bacteroidota bacterium]|jgi:choice-of-anchor B domain-containing protein
MKYVTITILLTLSLQAFSQNANIQFRSQITYPFTCANIWGYVDAQGNEYALVGTEQGLSICDVTNPDAATELFAVPHNANFWREVKTFANRAYVVNEDGGGVLIVDLSQLPDTVTYHSFTGYDLKTAHTVWIDEFGKMYLFGYNTNNAIPEDQRGIMVLDLNADPDNPVLLGTWNDAYVHDGFVRGDTAWLGLILDGELAVLDVSDPQNMQLMALQSTPSAFCHNAWPTSDNHYVFTTDEKPNSFLTCYDVSSLNNIFETDRIQSSPGSDVVIHNVHLLNNDFAWASYYRDGVLLYDISDKENMVQVGNFDTSPLQGDGFNGDWGVYPYFPSGTIVLSDIEGGLFVLTPTYVKAARIQGLITNSVTGLPVNNVEVSIVSTTENDNSDIDGAYKMGMASGGNYTLQFTRFGYQNLSIPVTLINDSIITLDIELVPIPSYAQHFIVVDSASGNEVPGAKLFITDFGLYNYEASGNNNGEVVIDTFYDGDYDIFCAAWGYKTKLFSGLSISNSNDTIALALPKGYYDDFYFDMGWTKETNATVGQWIRDVPNGTQLNGLPCNPGQDIVGDFGARCYVTGNTVGNSPGEDDVDNGCVILKSPKIDLSTYSNPRLLYAGWFCNSGGVNTPNDSLKVMISNGIELKMIDLISAQDTTDLSEWKNRSIDLNDIILLTDSMHLYIQVCDAAPGHLVEGGFDFFRIVDSVANTTGVLSKNPHAQSTVYPNPADEYIILNSTTLEPDAQIRIQDITGRTLFTQMLTGNKQQIDIRTLQAGTYLLSYQSPKNQYVIKFIKR